MQIQINYRDFDQSDALDAHIESAIESHLGHMADKLTRVEVHLGDESSVSKHTPGDKRCLIEARPRGLDPLTAEDHADDIFNAVSGAAGKIKRVLTTRFEKLASS
ncbi:MAG: HPF/RaiA family ribosome-associated protein [Planctomycetota bacterium]